MELGRNPLKSGQGFNAAAIAARAYEKKYAS